MPQAGSLGSRTGTVTSFDEPRGLGEITSEDGDVHAFHCTGIADGSRTIEVGAAVRYDLIPGRLGRWEAWDITPSTS
jgi:cold shock CspA family protein